MARTGRKNRVTVAHAVSLSYARSDHMSPAAVAMTTTLHVAVAAALYWISPLNYIDTTPDAIAITMEREVPPPPKPETPQPPPTPEPTPPPQAAAPSAPPPPPAPPVRMGLAPIAPNPSPDPKATAGRRAACTAQARNTGRPGRATRTAQGRAATGARHAASPTATAAAVTHARERTAAARCAAAAGYVSGNPEAAGATAARPQGAAADRTARAARADTAAAAAATACAAILAAFPSAAAATRPAGVPPGADPRQSGRHVRHEAGGGAVRLAHRPEGFAASAVRAQRHDRGGQPGAAHHDCPRRPAGRCRPQPFQRTAVAGQCQPEHGPPGWPL